MIRTYSELVSLKTFRERCNYLQLHGKVGDDTFGFDRYLNQSFYRSSEWKRIRDEVIIRDNGCDLACDGYEIFGKILIHHLNPITKEDIINQSEYLLNPEFLITTTKTTHDAIHYGDVSLLITEPVTRAMNDTCPWRK